MSDLQERLTYATRAWERWQDRAEQAESAVARVREVCAEPIADEERAERRLWRMFHKRPEALIFGCPTTGLRSVMDCGCRACRAQVRSEAAELERWARKVAKRARKVARA